jgi:hypothetical protein
MSAPNLKPWSLRPLGIAGVILFCIFTVAVVTLMIYALPTMRIRVLSKVLFVIGAVATLGFVLTLAMWHRYWKEVAWDIGFWPFITGPAPSDAYPEAIQAWLWGRRSMHCWFIMVVSVTLIPFVETVVY